MASVKPHKGKWRVFIFKAGVRKTKVFDVKAQATAWAAQTEADIISGKSGAIPDKTFGQLLARYADEVSITKRGAKWEINRINLLCRDGIAGVKLRDLKQTDLASWRDARLRVVSPASVCREMNILSHALNVAMNEWKWLPANPLKGVRRPPPTRPRDRRPSGDEIDRLTFAMGYSPAETPANITARVGAACLFAIETAMRCGEICAMTWPHVHLARRFVHIPMSKNGLSRDVPLSAEAIRLLNQLPRDGESVFGLATSQVDALFRKAKEKAMVEGLTFHDFRHEAITRLARKLDVLDLARMVGHRDLRQLAIYYNATAEEMAGRLD